MKNTCFLAALLFFGVSLSASAQDGKVDVLYLDGTSHVVQMSAVAKLEVSGGNASLVAKDGTAVATHKISDIDKIVLTSGATSVASVKASRAITLRSDGYTITADGMTDGAELAVYTAGGAVAARATAHGGHARIDASRLGSGVYVVRAEGQSMKMVKR